MITLTKRCFINYVNIKESRAVTGLCSLQSSVEFMSQHVFTTWDKPDTECSYSRVSRMVLRMVVAADCPFTPPHSPCPADPYQH